MSRKPFIDIAELKVDSVTHIRTERKKFTSKEIAKFWDGPYELPKYEKLMLDLFFKRKTPKNEEEECLLMEMMKIVKSGMILDVRGEVF